MNDGLWASVLDSTSVRTSIGYLIALILAFLTGSIPFGYLVARWKAGIDIRQHGSGNIGATNVGRVLGLRFFILVFLLDFAKGAAPVGLALFLRGRHQDPESFLYEQFMFLPELVGFACILGHVFPVYLHFKGGKGVATTIGVILLLAPQACLSGLAGFMVLFVVSRMVSVGSLGFALAFVLGHFFGPWSTEPFAPKSAALSVFVLLIGLLVIIKHRTNIERIIKGTEPRVHVPWESSHRR